MTTLQGTQEKVGVHIYKRILKLGLISEIVIRKQLTKLD